MILEFSVKNFLSFKDKVTFSLIANSNNGLDNNYITINDKKILKTSAIYGANASGKTNIFKIIDIVIKMLKKSNNNDVFDKLPIIPFKFDDSINNSSEFEIKFIVNNIRYVYGFIADKNIIYEEYLYYYPNGRETKIFDRTNKNNYSFSQKEFKILNDIAIKNAPNKFFIASATNWNYEKTKIPYKFLTQDINVFYNISDIQENALKEYFINDDKLRKFTLEFLKKADFNIIDYKVIEVDIPKELMPNMFKENKILTAIFKHKDSNLELTYEEESKGTQIIFSFIPFIMDAINNKKVIMIDELDRSLHPYLVEMIVELFNDTDINKSSSQLIFDTHDTNLLKQNILRRDQIWFIEKNPDNGVSDLFPLSDFKVRKDENIEKGYLLGRYGAVPFIKNDFILWEEK